MLTLVIGGSGSGKSAYAEHCAVLLSQTEKEGKTVENQKYYLATMQVFDGDAEGRKKVERHRQLRRDKGFVTIEQPTDICMAVSQMGSEEEAAGGRTALLECVSNLTANEMFSEERPLSAERVSAKLVREIVQLRQSVTHLVVVSGNVFEDGTAYDAATMEYIRAMGRINQGLAAVADRVVEVVAGLPLLLKS